MIEFSTVLVSITTSLLGLLWAVPSRIADRIVRPLGYLVTFTLAVQGLAALALVSTIATTAFPWNYNTYTESITVSALRPVILINGISGLMLLMVSIVGFAVSRYSVRYLEGESIQGRYFRWLGITLSAVTLMVVAGHLILLVVAWMLASVGLHQLLLHYRHRPAAHRAAWTKFAISRLGDMFLIAALVLIFQTYGTLDIALVNEKAIELATSSQVTFAHSFIGWLLVLGAVTKSALFPFHTWLPNTMETPTPVSALMHAGVVNAGGYLIIRMSPLVSCAPDALAALALLGAFTACFAGLVMTTQPSVKGALAYSTIAQMGFMMLQCGLGAFSAAMLHLLAHSFYKAYAFLNSGSVVERSKAVNPGTLFATQRLSHWLFSAALVVVAITVSSSLLEFNFYAKSGGIVLSFILCVALATWCCRLLSLGTPRTTLVGVVGVFAFCCIYVGSLGLVNSMVAPWVGETKESALGRLVHLDVFLSFCVMLLLHIVLIRRFKPTWIEPIRIHASNGFYIDLMFQRMFRSLTRA